jgi:hypothetical protein
MKNANALIGNTKNDNSKFCLAKRAKCISSICRMAARPISI